MTTNLFDYFEEVSGDDGAHAPWAARAPRRTNADFDVKLVPRAPNWQGDPESLDALERLGEQPWAGALTRRDDGVELRLSDSWIETTGAALEAGGGDEAELGDLARGQRFAVQFWDANATKALHVGHLRNLAIGNALAASLEQAGGEVERRCIISDAGRSMGEAMAGIIRSGHHTQSWPEGDQKSDHFVGLCYADYVASGGFAEEGTGRARGFAHARAAHAERRGRRAAQTRAERRGRSAGAVVQDARMGDLRPAQDARAPWRRL